jgi:hemoglobin
MAARQHDAILDEDRPMTIDVRSTRRATARACFAVLPVILAGCASLFPAPRGAGGGSAPAAQSESPKPPTSLYRRLGGYDGIAAFVDDFLGRATNDPAIVPFFRGLTTADLQRIRQHVVDLLCSAAGGPCFYPGRDMKTVHAQMEITNDVWNAFTGHLNESVARFRIADRERNELVEIVGSLRKDIVNK